LGVFVGGEALVLVMVLGMRRWEVRMMLVEARRELGKEIG
jgi:hypothetical protein